MQELDIEELKQVNGGVGEAADSLTKFQEFEKAWEAAGYAAQGGTRHQLEAMYEEWEAQGFKPGAAEYLLGKAGGKTIKAGGI